MSRSPGTRLRTPEVAQRLGVEGPDVYRLIFAGELDGQPDEDGIVGVTEASVARYLKAHARPD
jgi:hypothetical protein